MSLTSAPENSGELSLETPEQAAERVSGNSGNPENTSTLAIVDQIKELEKTNPAAAADLQNDLDVKYTADHHAHVGVYQSHLASERSRNNLDAHVGATEIEKSMQESVNDDVSSLLNKRNQSRDNTSFVKSLLSVYKESGAIENKSIWSRYEDAIKTNASMIGDEKERSAILELADLGGNRALNMLARGPVNGEDRSRVKSKALSSSMSEEQANKSADDFVRERTQEYKKAEEILAKLGVDVWNI